MLCNQECFVMSPLKYKIIIQKRKYQVLFTKNMPKIHISANPKQKICATRHIFFQYVQWSRSVIQACCTGQRTADTCWNAARLFHENTHLKGLRGICPGNACSSDTCGTPGRKNKVIIISTSENKANPTTGWIKGLQDCN